MTAPAWLEDVIVRATCGDTPADPRATARRVLATWRRAVGGSVQLRRRLRRAGCRRVAPRLSAPVVGDPAVDWAGGLRRVVAALASCPATAAATFEELIGPLAVAAGADVRARLRQNGVELDRFIDAAARAELGRAIVRRVAEPLRPAWTAWCDEHPLTRLAGEEPALAALQEELASSALRSIFERFPVAARLAGTAYHLEIAAQVELLRRIARDLLELQARWTLRLPAEAPPVRDLRLHLGDPHRGGRAAACIEFADGTRIAAKARSVALEQVLESWWREHDPERPALRYLDREDHGWMEWIEAAPPVDAAASARLHRRLGALLARAREFGLCDLHRGNVLFAGEHPFVVDGECLRPAVPLDGAVGAVPGDPVEDVLEVGILPRWLRRPGGRLDARSLLDTDLGEAEVEAVVAGFLEATPAPHPAERLAAVASARARYLVRPTAVYSLLQRRLLQPDALADICLFDALTDTLARGWTNEIAPPRCWPLIEAERRALFRLDVPAFDYEPRATQVRACDGTQLDAAFASAPAAHWPARNAGRNRVEREQTRGRYAALLRRVLAAPAPLILKEGEDAVAAIVCHIVTSALPGADDAPTWLGYDCDPAEIMVRPSLADEGIYSGRAGIALFLLAAAGRCPEAGATAAGVFDALVATRPCASHGWAGGLAGRAIALRAAGEFAGRPDWIRAANDAVAALTLQAVAAAEKDAGDWAQFDLFSGLAGAALALTETASTLDAASTAVAALQRWLEREPPRRVGLMHGSAGLAVAAGRVAAAAAHAGRPVDAIAAWRTAMRAVEWENRSATPPSGLWSPSHAGFDGSWCNHTAGIALARHALLRCADAVGAVTASDRLLLETDMARARGHLLCAPAAERGLLCCGQLGRLVALLLTGEADDAEVRQRLAAWRADIGRHGWNLDATPDHAWLPPSLGRGLAGAGWVLLAAEDARARERLRAIVGFAPSTGVR